MVQIKDNHINRFLAEPGGFRRAQCPNSAHANRARGEAHSPDLIYHVVPDTENGLTVYLSHRHPPLSEPGAHS
jgi:hypothetical protein